MSHDLDVRSSVAPFRGVIKENFRSFREMGRRRVGGLPISAECFIRPDSRPVSTADTTAIQRSIA